MPGLFQYETEAEKLAREQREEQEQKAKEAAIEHARSEAVSNTSSTGSIMGCFSRMIERLLGSSEDMPAGPSSRGHYRAGYYSEEDTHRRGDYLHTKIMRMKGF
jgi:hypothetical protein